jgi:anti-sigma factor (TIGR02949 family)
MSERLDCRQVVDRLYDFLDGELTATDAEEVRAHMAACAHCFERSDFEAAFLRFLEARGKGKDCPPEVRRRILDSLL